MYQPCFDSPPDCRLSLSDEKNILTWHDSHLLFNVPLAKLYTNSLMSSLNARGGWKYNMPSQLTNPHGSNTQQAVSASSNVSYFGQRR